MGVYGWYGGVVIFWNFFFVIGLRVLFMYGCGVFIVGGFVLCVRLFFRVVGIVWYVYLRDWWGGLFFWCLVVFVGVFLWGLFGLFLVVCFSLVGLFFDFMVFLLVG